VGGRVEGREGGSNEGAGWGRGKRVRLKKTADREEGTKVGRRSVIRLGPPKKGGGADPLPWGARKTARQGLNGKKEE